MTRTWFRPYHSLHWHVADPARKFRVAVCGGWPVYVAAKREDRPDDAAGNCPVCLRRLLAEKGADE